ncbi:glycerol-3-phosphate transporter [Klebsiella pneumoniae]|nr:glycerol-3-phosphate transporter [Klebsiella pneumoniae]
MLSIFKPAAHKARLPAAEIDPLYRRLRWQIFIGIFFGYAAYYLVRKNFALAMPYLIEQGVLSWRPRLRPFRYLHRLWIFEIHHGIGL